MEVRGRRSWRLFSTISHPPEKLLRYLYKQVLERVPGSNCTRCRVKFSELFTSSRNFIIIRYATEVRTSCSLTAGSEREKPRQISWKKFKAFRTSYASCLIAKFRLIFEWHSYITGFLKTGTDCVKTAFQAWYPSAYTQHPSLQDLSQGRYYPVSRRTTRHYIYERVWSTQTAFNSSSMTAFARKRQAVMLWVSITRKLPFNMTFFGDN